MYGTHVQGKFRNLALNTTLAMPLSSIFISTSMKESVFVRKKKEKKKRGKESRERANFSTSLRGSLFPVVAARNREKRVKFGSWRWKPRRVTARFRKSESRYDFNSGIRKTSRITEARRRRRARIPLGTRGYSALYVSTRWIFNGGAWKR